MENKMVATDLTLNDHPFADRLVDVVPSISLGMASLVFFVGGLLDTLTTYWGIQTGNFAESVPFVVSLIETHGLFFGLVGAKLVAVVCVFVMVGALSVIIPRLFAQLLTLSMTLFGCWYLVAAVHNAALMFAFYA